VTGCRFGKRALKFRDWGKVAATFVDLETGRAVRVAAKESSKALARRMHPEIPDKNQQQMLAYREMADDDLFTMQWMKIELPPEEFPGYKDNRIVCVHAAKGINFRREVHREGKVLCRSCAGERYYEPASFFHAQNICHPKDTSRHPRTLAVSGEATRHEGLSPASA
jgi:formylmethanofuran dehydrogenase subunit E